MVLFPPVLQVCCFSAVIVTVNSYVLFAANLDDFRNLAKKFISEDLSEKLTRLVSQTSHNDEKKKSEKSSEEDLSKGVERNMEDVYENDKLAEVTVDKPRQKHERMENKFSTFAEIINRKGKTGPIEIMLDDYEKLNTRSDVRKEPVPVKNNHNEKHFENDHVKQDEINLRDENDRAQNSYAKKRPVDNEFGNYELQNENRKERPIINKLQNNEMQNKRPFVNEFENDEEQNGNREIPPAKNTYDNDKSQVDKYENVESATTTYATAKSKRYRTVKRLPPSKSWFEQAQSYEKRKDVSLINKNSQNPKELLYDKEESKNIPQENIEEENNHSSERNKRKDRYKLGVRESSYDKKTTTESQGDREEFERIQPKLADQEDIINMNSRYKIQRTTKNEDVTESDLIYEKVLLNAPIKPKLADKERMNINSRYKIQRTTKNEDVTENDLIYEKVLLNAPIKPKLADKERMNINSRYKIQRTTKNEDVTESDLIYEKLLLNKRNSEEENVTVRKISYYEDESYKPEQKAKRPESPSIMESPAERGQRPDLPLNIERQNQKQQNLYMGAQDIYAKMTKKTHDKLTTKKKHFVDYNEEEDEPREIQFEAVKARTESLIYKSGEANDAGSSKPFIMKGTGVPTRQRYKMVTPDYYKKLPRIVEKYDFNEPIPEGDREREVFDDKKLAALEPARVNKKVRQQRESVRAKMDDISWSS